MTPEFTVKAGSWMYGTNVPESDIDHRGFFMPSLRQTCGFSESKSAVTNTDERDEAWWEVRHYVKLCCQANPNVLETAFAPDDCIVKKTKFAQKILDLRESFLSRQVATTYMGYARGNYLRVTKNKPPGDPYAYDGKDTMHLVRLVRMGAEALQTGVLRVRRTEDREFFLKIRRNEIPWGQIVTEFEGHTASWRDLEAKSPLPPKPDLDTIDQQLAALVFERLAETHDGYI